MAAESRHSLICVFFPSTNFATFFQKKTFWRCAGTNDPMPGDPSYSRWFPQFPHLPRSADWIGVDLHRKFVVCFARADPPTAECGRCFAVQAFPASPALYYTFPLTSISPRKPVSGTSFHAQFVRNPYLFCPLHGTRGQNPLWGLGESTLSLGSVGTLDPPTLLRV